MNAVESVRQQLSLSVRVDDHFSGAPWPYELDVTLDSGESPVPAVGGSGNRHADGTYRFISARPGPRLVSVRPLDDAAFTWTASTAVTLPRVGPLLTTPLAIELWPGPSMALPAGTLAIRGRLVSAGAGQEVGMEVVGVAPRNRRTRCNANGEFLFVVVGPMELTTAHKVELAVSVPGRTLTSIQVIDGATNPVVAGTHFAVVPGRETRAHFNLS